MQRFLTRSAIALALFAAVPAFADVTLDGRSVTPESIARIADGEAVSSRLPPASGSSPRTRCC